MKRLEMETVPDFPGPFFLFGCVVRLAMSELRYWVLTVTATACEVELM